MQRHLERANRVYGRHRNNREVFEPRLRRTGPPLTPAGADRPQTLRRFGC